MTITDFISFGRSSRPRIVDALLAAAIILITPAVHGQFEFESTQLYSQTMGPQDGPFDLDGGEESGDRAAASLAAGDFDGDGYLDLAIGVPFEGHTSHQWAGWVSVIYGDTRGLDASTVVEQVWSQHGAIQGAVEDEDLFGSTLATGDFDGDGFDDLIVGATNEDITVDDQTFSGAGSINVIYGSKSGLVEERNLQLWPGRPVNGGVVAGEPQARIRTDEALAVGDFDGDAHDDLAVCGRVHLCGRVGVRQISKARSFVLSASITCGGHGCASSTKRCPDHSAIPSPSISTRG